MRSREPPFLLLVHTVYTQIGACAASAAALSAYGLGESPEGGWGTRGGPEDGETRGRVVWGSHAFGSRRAEPASARARKRQDSMRHFSQFP